MPLPRRQLKTAANVNRNGLSVKSRIGFKGNAKSTGIQSRLGGGGAGAIIDARQKINLNRTQSGRIGRVNDARSKIEAKRATATGTGRITNKNLGFGSKMSSSSTIKNLVITTSNSPPAPGLFRNAVSGMGQWGYIPPTVQQVNRTSTPMLTRTIANPLARNIQQVQHTQQFPAPKGPAQSPYFGASATSMSIAKVAPSFSMHSDRFREDFRSTSRDDAMDVDRPLAAVRSSMQSRLDSPKFKIRIANLQQSVSLDDIVELFSDVGDLVTAKITTPGNAEAYYKTKSDCLKAVDAYHNRLLDGSPMKVTLLEEETFPVQASTKSARFTPLKSASGASIKLPKSSSTIKIHPDLSAIHKVLFQPSSSSNAAKMLFKGAGQ